MPAATTRRTRTAIAGGALVLAALAALGVAAPAAQAGPQILNPVEGFDMHATEMWFDGSRDRIWMRADNHTGVHGRVTGIRCTSYVVVNRDPWAGNEREIIKSHTVNVRGDLPAHAWIGWSFKAPVKLIERDSIHCWFVGTDSTGRPESNTRNNGRTLYGYGRS